MSKGTQVKNYMDRSFFQPRPTHQNTLLLMQGRPFIGTFYLLLSGKKKKISKSFLHLLLSDALFNPTHPPVKMSYFRALYSTTLHDSFFQSN